MSTRPEAFVVDTFTPAYAALRGTPELAERARRALESLRECRACPRRCGVDRMADDTGICHIGRYARVTSAFPHFGEEDCLRGTAGSGTIFFGRCNLHCVFCQNADISQTDSGRPCTGEELSHIMLALQDQGCHNINLVTPEHVVPQMIEAIAIAVENGLSLPIVYNTSAYDSLESLHELDGLIDIYMPDFKLWSAECGARLLGARDYGEQARKAIAEMHRQTGDLRLTRDGVTCRGVLVRHLVMPGLLDETAAILRWLAGEVSRDTYINIMGQYRPEHLVVEPAAGKDGVRHSPESSVRYADINRRPTREELHRAYELAREVGLWRFA